MKQKLKIGGNANVRLALYNQYRTDANIIEKAWKNTLQKLQEEAYMECTAEEALALYEKEKNAVSEKHSVAGILDAFNKRNNI